MNQYCRLEQVTFQHPLLIWKPHNTHCFSCQFPINDLILNAITVIRVWRNFSVCVCVFHRENSFFVYRRTNSVWRNSRHARGSILRAGTVCALPRLGLFVGYGAIVMSAGECICVSASVSCMDQCLSIIITLVIRRCCDPCPHRKVHCLSAN
jgi:hypothetical protein